MQFGVETLPPGCVSRLSRPARTFLARIFSRLRVPNGAFHAAFLGRDAGEDHPRTATRHWPVHGAQHDDTGHSRCASRRGCSAVIPPDPERRLTEPPLKKRVSAEPKSPVVVVVRRPRRTKSLTRFSCCFFLLPQRLLPRRRPPPAPEGEDPDFGRRVRRHSGRRVEGSRRRPKPNGDGTRRARARDAAFASARPGRLLADRSVDGGAHAMRRDERLERRVRGRQQGQSQRVRRVVRRRRRRFFVAVARSKDSTGVTWCVTIAASTTRAPDPRATCFSRWRPRLARTTTCSSSMADARPSRGSTSQV